MRILFQLLETRSSFKSVSVGSVWVGGKLGGSRGNWMSLKICSLTLVGSSSNPNPKLGAQKKSKIVMRSSMLCIVMMGCV